MMAWALFLCFCDSSCMVCCVSCVPRAQTSQQPPMALLPGVCGLGRGPLSLWVCWFGTYRKKIENYASRDVTRNTYLNLKQLKLKQSIEVFSKATHTAQTEASRVGTYSPPSLCRFATQGFLPLRWRWDAASPRPVCVWLCEDL